MDKFDSLGVIKNEINYEEEKLQHFTNTIAAMKNQNHRLSRWFALRVQPFVTGQRYSALKRLPFSPLFLAAAKAAYFSFYLLPDYFLLASFRRLTRKRVK